MRFKIPFTLLPLEDLKRKASPIIKSIHLKKNSFKSLDEKLKSTHLKITKEEYIGICYRSAIIFLASSLILTALAFILFIKDFYGLAPLVPLCTTLFVFFKQITYPKMFIINKAKDIEKNLIPAMQDIMVQLNSGVPVFDILNNISKGEYGEVSREFAVAVKEINTGRPQVEVLDEMGNKNTSVYFRRILWQISNGLRSGSDMSSVIKEGIDNLNQEQVVQIQSYGSRLNPIILFYMLMVIIIPALAVTFFTIVSSMIRMGKIAIIFVFFAIFAGVVLLQILFLGMVRTRRPSLI